MKRLVVILALAALLGLGAYFVSYGIARCTFCRVPDAKDSSGWMRQEFHLTEAQYAQVKQLEIAYHPHCAEMCLQIGQSRLTLKNLILANGTMTPDIEAALKKDGEVQQQCRENMLRHFYEVSQALPPAEGKRYLQIMQAQVVEPEKTSSATAAQH
jgi:Spy/CpxP family protein refolding chaperone